MRCQGVKAPQGWDSRLVGGSLFLSGEQGAGLRLGRESQVAARDGRGAP